MNISIKRRMEEEMVEIMKKKSLAVVGFSETIMNGSGEKVFHGNYKLICSGEEDGRHGVGVILSFEFAPYVESVESVSERAFCISIKTKTNAIFLIQVHAPQRGRPSHPKTIRTLVRQLDRNFELNYTL